jgi:hypothetical protein
MKGEGDPFTEFERKHGLDTDKEPGKLFVDLGKIIANGLEPERPSVACLSPEKGMLYKGRINEIHGEPGVGKTNLALCFALTEMADGGHVLFIDPEDTPVGILNRLKAFGADMEMVVERPLPSPHTGRV